MVDYGVLKTNIFKACKMIANDPNSEKRNVVKFQVSYDKLENSVDDYGLILLKSGLNSRPIRTLDVPFLSEYFKSEKLKWIDKNKEYTTLVFVVKEAIDDNCKQYISIVNNEVSGEVDRINALSNIIASYPCYLATIVSYESNDMKRMGKPSYEMICRANTVVIRSAEYKYNPKDMVQ